MRPLSAPLVAALRDRAYREGFQMISTHVMDADWPLLAADAIATDERLDVYELPLIGE